MGKSTGFVKSMVGKTVKLGLASKADIYPDGGYTVSGKTDDGWRTIEAGVRYVSPSGVGYRSILDRKGE